MNEIFNYKTILFIRSLEQKGLFNKKIISQTMEGEILLLIYFITGSNKAIDNKRLETKNK